jgi:hypothetical protein
MAWSRRAGILLGGGDDAVKRQIREHIARGSSKCVVRRVAASSHPPETSDGASERGDVVQTSGKLAYSVLFRKRGQQSLRVVAAD